MVKRLNRGQNFIEYTLLIIVVAAALTVMTTYITRAVYARIKVTQDELDPR